MCTAVGDAIAPGGNYVPLAEREDGHGWRLQSTPDLADKAALLDGVSCSGIDACMAVGEYTVGSYTGFPPGQSSGALVEHWNGRQWSVQAAPNSAYASQIHLESISCTSSRACTTAGYYFDLKTKYVRALFEHWNGATWRIQKAAPDQQDNSFGSVSCVSDIAFVAVGTPNDTFDVGALAPSPMAEVWNGKDWRMTYPPLPPGGSGAYLASVSCPAARRCYAVGQYTINDSYEGLAEEWNGSRWSVQSIADKTFYTATAISCAGGDACFMAGFCASLSGRCGSAGSIVFQHWDGKTWTSEHGASLPISPPFTYIGAQVEGLSCPAPAACVAVGARPTPDPWAFGPQQTDSPQEGNTSRTLVEAYGG